MALHSHSNNNTMIKVIWGKIDTSAKKFVLLMQPKPAAQVTFNVTSQWGVAFHEADPDCVLPQPAV